MPLRILAETITVIRDKKAMRLKPGTEFNFTAEEIAEIEGTKDKPGTRPQALKRKTVEVADKVEPAVAAVKPAPVAPVAAKPAPAAAPAPAPADAPVAGNAAADAGL